MRELIGISFCFLLFYASAFAATQEGRPDREMLRMMELLRDWEMLKNLEIVRDLESVERAGNSPAEPSPQKSRQKMTKEQPK